MANTMDGLKQEVIGHLVSSGDYDNVVRCIENAFNDPNRQARRASNATVLNSLICQCVEVTLRLHDRQAKMNEKTRSLFESGFTTLTMNEEYDVRSGMMLTNLNELQKLDRESSEPG